MDKNKIRYTFLSFFLFFFIKLKKSSEILFGGTERFRMIGSKLFYNKEIREYRRPNILYVKSIGER